MIVSFTNSNPLVTIKIPVTTKSKTINDKTRVVILRFRFLFRILSLLKSLSINSSSTTSGIDWWLHRGRCPAR